MARLRRDVVESMRHLRQSPMFVAAVLMTMSVSIGMAVAMFTVFDVILVRPLPVQEQDRIAVLWPYHEPAVELSPPATDLPAIRRASRTMSAIAGVEHSGVTSTAFLDGDRTLLLNGTLVTANFFSVLGARPVLGRFLRPHDEEPGAPRVMVLSYGAWHSHFGGTESVVGRQIIDAYSGVRFTVVGVAPPGLDYPVGIDTWVPVARDAPWRALVVARLASDASLETVRSEFFSIVNRVRPEWDLRGAAAQPLAQAMLGDARPIVMALGAAVALLLLIACVNVGSLFLIRSASRARELAVRRALGASYGSLVGRGVVEAVLLAAAAGAMGLAGAKAVLGVLVSLAPPQLPRLDAIPLHGNMLGAAIGVTAIAVLVFGLLPALMTTRINLASALRHDARSGAGTRRGRRIREWVVISQVALAVLMLAAAGVLGRSLWRLEHLELGYQAEDLWIGSVAFDAREYDSNRDRAVLGERVTERVRVIPEVVAVTPIMMPPFQGPSISLAFFEAESQGRSALNGNPAIPLESAGPDYFRTFGTPLLRGRGFLESDGSGALPVVVVSESVARRYWPGEEPLGKRLRFAPSSVARNARLAEGFLDWRTVIGVVPDTRFRLLRETSPMVYLPARQFGGWGGRVAVRFNDSADVGPAAIRRAVREVHPRLVLFNLQSIDALLAERLAEPRLAALLLTSFAIAALVLAAVGLYGMMASVIRERAREIGIRMALGATPARVRSAVIGQSLLLAIAGCIGGLAAAFAATRLLRALLFEVSPVDPVTLVGVCFVLLTVAATAAYVPARRAVRIDTVRVLKTE